LYGFYDADPVRLVYIVLIFHVLTLSFINNNLVVYPTIEAPNGWRYPLVGGTRQRHFDGTNFKPRKLPKNAQTSASEVQAVSVGMLETVCV
jgi:hypothetical protein